MGVTNKMRRAYIYAITLTHDAEKFYVGSTVTVAARRKQHLLKLLNGKHHSVKLQRAFKKHKCNDFEFQVIEECSQEDRNNREQHWINHYNSLDFGYNMVPVDIKSAHTNEMRAKLRISKIERYQELEDKILNLFETYDGVTANSYCDVKEFWGSNKFCIYGARNRRTDNKMIETCINNITSFQEMIEEWLLVQDKFVKLNFQKDSFYTKAARNRCDSFYGMPSTRDYLIHKTNDVKNSLDATKNVNSIVSKCLGSYESDSIYSQIMENITAKGYDMLKQIPVTRRSCKNDYYQFTVDYLSITELKKLGLIRLKYSNLPS